MRAVFKHELSSYFTGLIGYIFGAFLLLACGYSVMVWNLQGLNSTFEVVTGDMSIVFIVVVPILTMRVLAEERRQRTDQLLYALPLTMTQVVLGKYFAMLVVLLIPTAIICLYPVLLGAYGTVYLLSAFTSILGFVLLGGALLAMGMYISSITENVIVSAILCLAVMAANYTIAYASLYLPATAYASFVTLMVVGVVIGLIAYFMTKNYYAAIAVAGTLDLGIFLTYKINAGLFENLVPKVVVELSLYERFYSLLNGLFDLTGVVYLLSVAGLFLFMSVQSMEKRRWSE